MYYVYLVLYRDGSIAIFSNKQSPKAHQSGAQFFKVKDSLTVGEISECAYVSWNFERVAMSIQKKFCPF